MMSLAAVMGGLFIYYHRLTPVSLPGTVPRAGGAEFEKGVVAVTQGARRLMAWLDNGSL